MVKAQSADRQSQRPQRDSDVPRYYEIGEVARKLRLSQKRIRDYEKEGFINPRRHPRTKNRLYTDFELNQLRRIHYLIRRRGFTIKSLKQLFRYAPCWEIFRCNEKDSCVAYQSPHEPCWRANLKCACDRPCESCVVYLMRGVKKEKILTR
jgi:hypothetical protein